MARLSAVLLLSATVSFGCAARQACERAAKKVCEPAGLSCGPLVAAFEKRPRTACQKAAQALDRTDPLPADLKAPAILNIAARLLGVGREYRTIERAKVRLAGLVLAASRNQPTQEDEHALFELGPISCVVVVPTYAQEVAARAALRRVLVQLAGRDHGEQSGRWRQWCREVVANQAPALDLLGL